MKEMIEAGLLLSGTIGLMASGVAAIALIPGAQIGVLLSFYSLLAAFFSAEM